MHEFQRGVSPPGRCSYLPQERSRTEYRVLGDVSGERYAEMLSRGWRRQGQVFFRPACPACVRCRSLRVPVATFRPTKSQRRCRNRNEREGVELEVVRPELTATHLALYDAYHEAMHRDRGWDREPADPEEYWRSFVAGDFAFAREFRYWRKGTLVGVGYVDVVPRALNSIYFFHDPEWRPLGPGTYSAVKELEYAAAVGCGHVYFGYWIPENASMSYNNRFGPHELMIGFPGVRQTPRWREVG
ncbi:MAG: arginyltransferase, partial [Planctomycetota bacterium]